MRLINLNSGPRSRILRSIVRCYSFIGSQAHGHVPRNREAWNADLEESDASGADLSRYIGYDIKFGIDVAAQLYTEIIDEVNLCLRITHQNLAQTQ
jgi:hypothetical protein